MKVVIAGGHGQIAQLLSGLLTARGDSVVGLIRNPAHGDDVRATGAAAQLGDLESMSVSDLAAHVRGADAVVFAAGAGPGSTAARKDTVDRDAAILLADAARHTDVRRYLMVSAIGVDEEPAAHADEVWAAYVRAKRAADDAVRARDLDWTILRPAALTNDPAVGRVELAPAINRAPVTRADVAAVLLGLLDAPNTAGQTLELGGGETPIAAAIAAIK